MSNKPSCEQGNKLIAEFMDLYNAKNDYPFIQPDCKVMLFKFGQYHSSWDWQIPAWSKVAKLIKKIAEDGVTENAMYMGFLHRYEKAVFNNEPAEGQQTIVYAIEWYNKNTEI